MRPANSQALSLALHVLLAALLVWIGARSSVVLPEIVPRPSRLVRLLAFPRKASVERGGGSNHTESPARRDAPPPQAHRTFILPPQSTEPKLRLQQTFAFAVPEPALIAAQMGDPLSRYASGSLGVGVGVSIGVRGCCDGVGDERTGRPGLGSQRVRATTPPRVLYQVEPEFSEEARKAKYQGIVVLSIEVDINGRAREIRVLRSLGLGLDEKAVEAVAQWRFQPGSVDGHPIISTAIIEVNFHLL